MRIIILNVREVNLGLRLGSRSVLGLGLKLISMFFTLSRPCFWERNCSGAMSCSQDNNDL